MGFGVRTDDGRGEGPEARGERRKVRKVRKCDGKAWEGTLMGIDVRVRRASDFPTFRRLQRRVRTQDDIGVCVFWLNDGAAVCFACCRSGQCQDLIAI